MLKLKRREGRRPYIFGVKSQSKWNLFALFNLLAQPPTCASAQVPEVLFDVSLSFMTSIRLSRGNVATMEASLYLHHGKALRDDVALYCRSVLSRVPISIKASSLLITSAHTSQKHSFLIACAPSASSYHGFLNVSNCACLSTPVTS